MVNDEAKPGVVGQVYGGVESLIQNRLERFASRSPTRSRLIHLQAHDPARSPLGNSKKCCVSPFPELASKNHALRFRRVHFDNVSELTLVGLVCVMALI